MGRWERCGERREVGTEKADGLFSPFWRGYRQKMGSSTEATTRGRACCRLGYRAKTPKA